MTRFKYTDKYLNDIDDKITIAPVYKSIYRNDEDDDEEEDVYSEYTDIFPRRVIKGTTLL
jgi:hypothetical protein